MLLPASRNILAMFPYDQHRVLAQMTGDWLWKPHYCTVRWVFYVNVRGWASLTCWLQLVIGDDLYNARSVFVLPTSWRQWPDMDVANCRRLTSGCPLVSWSSLSPPSPSVSAAVSSGCPSVFVWLDTNVYGCLRQCFSFKLLSLVIFRNLISWPTEHKFFYI